jgi:hypothetical protein
MGKIKGIFITTVIIAGILIVTLVSVLFYESGKAEKTYEKAVEDMNKGDFKDALELVKDVPHYKNASEMYIYIYPNKIYDDEFKESADAVDAYKSAILFINTKEEYLNNNNGIKFKNDLDELKKVLNFKINELSAKSQNDFEKNKINDAILQIKQGNTQQGLFYLQYVTSNEYLTEKNEIKNYVNLQIAIQAKDDKSINNCISLLDPNYSGDFSNEIKTLVLSAVDQNKWTSLYKANTSNQNNGVMNCRSKDDVIRTMGNPVKTNNFENKYGKFEELVYADKTIYIENGQVASIK